MNSSMYIAFAKWINVMDSDIKDDLGQKLIWLGRFFDNLSNQKLLIQVKGPYIYQQFPYNLHNRLDR